MWKYRAEGKGSDVWRGRVVLGLPEMQPPYVC